MTVQYLTLEEILRLHFQVIEDYGGFHGVRDEGRLNSVVMAPAQSVFGKEQYPTIYDKAAVYLRNIIGDHPFSDGNKRTAVTVCAIFLSRNGSQLNSDSKTLENFTISVTTEHLNIEEISAWLNEHSRTR